MTVVWLRTKLTAFRLYMKYKNETLHRDHDNLLCGLILVYVMSKQAQAHLYFKTKVMIQYLCDFFAVS